MCVPWIHRLYHTSGMMVNAYSAYFVRKCFTRSQLLLLLLVLFITPSMHFFGQKVRITIAHEMEMMMMNTWLFFGA
jgi:hypothetical protein